MKKQLIEPYEALNPKEIPREEKRAVIGELIAVDRTKYGKRGLILIAPMTRALLANEIHELMITDEQDAGPGKKVNSVAIIGFLEIRMGGIVAVGDKVQIERKFVGEIAGFDQTHLPNHQNIVMKAKEIRSGVELGMRLGDRIIIG